jgi:LytS/YehU family sensor histidine kinase
VQEDGPVLLQSEDTGQNSGAVIASIRQRLRHLYGDQSQSFEVSNLAGKGVRMDLHIPFRQG